MPKVITAQHIVNLLAARHSDDVFVPECKNGPSMSGGHRRMDAWAMKKSWSKPRMFAYEIKVSRSDFLKDDKWTDYLEYCTDFYFVCPSKLIAPEELPDNVGLIWVSTTGTKLFTKRKAVFRDTSIPDEIYRYILMSRATIRSPNYYLQSGDAKAFWGRWLVDKKIDQDFGYRVSRTISKRFREEVEQVSTENKRLKSEIEKLESIKQRLKELGFNTMHTVNEWAVDEKLKELQQGFPNDFKFNIRNAINNLSKVQEIISKHDEDAA